MIESLILLSAVHQQ